MQQQNRLQGPLLIERIIAALSYINAWIGFIWLLIALFTKNNLKPFLRYHIFQSLFLYFCFFLLSILFNLSLEIISHIPFISTLIMNIVLFFNMPMIFNYSLIELAIYSIIFYLALTSFMGKYSYLPWISEIITTNVRG